MQVLCDLQVLFLIFNCQTPEYVHGEKFSGRGNCENGKLLVPGILYSES